MANQEAETDVLAVWAECVRVCSSLELPEQVALTTRHYQLSTLIALVRTTRTAFSCFQLTSEVAKLKV